MTYELINPSDKILLDAPDLEVASVCVTILGQGRYGLRAGEEMVMPILAFGDFNGWFVKQFGGDLDAVLTRMQGRKPEMVACLESFRLAGGGKPSSLNDICGMAHRIGCAVGAE